MKTTISLLLFLSSLQTVLSQQGTLSGKIMMVDSIRPLQGVSIYLDHTEFGGISNSSGAYTLSEIPEGQYLMVVSFLGYETLRQEINIQDNDSLILDFYMNESAAALGEVVIMTKGNTGLKDIPGSAQYLSPIELEKFSYTDINRTLRAVPGINMQEEDGFGLRPNIGLRGTGVDRSSKITIMEDGILAAPAPYAEPAAYYFPTIGRMQGVEILKGSSQIKYGPFTTGGAINMISSQLPDQLSAKVYITGGSYGGRSVHANVGNAHKNVSYLAETFQYGSEGFKHLDEGGDTGFDKKDYLAKLMVNTNKDSRIYQSLTFKMGQTTESSNETYLGLTNEDFKATPFRRYSGSQVDLMTTKHTQFSVSHFLKLSQGLTISTTAYRSDFSRNWYRLVSVTDSTGRKTSIDNLLQDPGAYADGYDIITGTSSTRSDALTVRANNRSYYARGIQTVMGYQFKSKKLLHDLQLGIRYHQDEVDRFQWEDSYAMVNGNMQLTKSGTPGTESNRIKSAKALATYLQYKLKFSRLTLIPGIRYENILLQEMNYGKADPDREGTALTESMNQVGVIIPGIGIDYQQTRYLSFFAGIHKGFSPPGVNDETIPEKSINYETGVRYAKNALSGQLVLFYNNYSNLLGADLAASGGGGSGDMFNAGRVHSKGIEFQASYDLLSGQGTHSLSLPLSVVYTYTDAVFQNSFVSAFDNWGTVTAGDQFPYLANHQVSFIVGLEHQKFAINLSGRYMDEMRTTPGQGEIPETEKTDAYFVLDASASFVLHRNISLFANATNLTDQVYIVARRPSGLRPGMPAAFNFGVKARI